MQRTCKVYMFKKKKSPGSITQHEPLKIPLSSFCVCHLLLGIGSAPKSGCTSETSQKNISLSSFWIKDWDMCSLPLSVLGPLLVQTLACCHSLYEFLYASVLLCLEGLVSFVSSIPLSLNTVPTSSEFPDP